MSIDPPPLQSVPLEDADSALYAGVSWQQASAETDSKEYLPLLHLARDQGVRLVPLGIPIETTNRVKGKRVAF